ncbi:hypothetical protein [Pseudomaricurvus sp. HS19]|uniref:hypothetical protein n=1 Tax=Pseudomaricurvus sp. HS19 TaxID=2692626 RepID=UPI00136CDA69|nr:hypothetical protein [Pseudomaricurvus sp. HS19]MYM62982.1 hypothetical protein [Pseudomaricurvus sp. HS19]
MLHKAGARFALTVVVMAGTPQFTYAQENTVVPPPTYIPDRPNYYNPLKHARSSRQHYDSGAKGMSNEQLATMAEYIRNNEMSAEQRALNHQWLEQEHYNDDIRVGGKVLSYLFRMGFRTYWDGLRNKHYNNTNLVPDGDGNGQITEEVEYKLRLSEDEARLLVEYEF